jgi:hypothetical protein
LLNFPFLTQTNIGHWLPDPNRLSVKPPSFAKATKGTAATSCLDSCSYSDHRQFLAEEYFLMQKIIGYTFLAFLILFIAYLFVSLAPPWLLPTTDRDRIISESIGVIAQEGWSFIKPLLQLAVIILILEYAAGKFGNGASLFKWQLPLDIRSLLALIVVVAFAVAALAGSETAGMLKDAALVVIGFYFGRSAVADSSDESKSRPNKPPEPTRTDSGSAVK